MFRWQHQRACSCPFLQTTSLVQLDCGVVFSVTDQHVVAFAAEKVVGSDAAIRRVVATAAIRRVVATAAVQRVVASLTKEIAVAGELRRGKQRTEIVPRNCSGLRMCLGLAV